jgi:hypothetical protein
MSQMYHLIHELSSWREPKSVVVLLYPILQIGHVLFDFPIPCLSGTLTPMVRKIVCIAQLPLSRSVPFLAAHALSVGEKFFNVEIV